MQLVEHEPLRQGSPFQPASVQAWASGSTTSLGPVHVRRAGSARPDRARAARRRCGSGSACPRPLPASTSSAQSARVARHRRRALRPPPARARPGARRAPRGGTAWCRPRRHLGAERHAMRAPRRRARADRRAGLAREELPHGKSANSAGTGQHLTPSDPSVAHREPREPVAVSAGEVVGESDPRVLPSGLADRERPVEAGEASRSRRGTRGDHRVGLRPAARAPPRARPRLPPGARPRYRPRRRAARRGRRRVRARWVR